MRASGRVLIRPVPRERDHRRVPVTPATTSNPRPRLTRRGDGRIVAGVAAGIGDHFGIDATVVRLAFVVLGLAGGVGVVLYLCAWLLMPDSEEPAGDEATGRPAGASFAAVTAPELDPVQVAALGAVVLGVLMLARTIGWWFGDAFVWPFALAGAGLALLWARPGRDGEAPDLPAWLARLPPAAGEAVSVLVGTRRGGIARFFVGAALVFVGVLAFAGSVDSWEAVRGRVLAPVIVVVGLALALGPGLWRLAGALVEERRERIRSQERAEMAAHLHDSVLQTLALVQRKAADPREVVRLARRQERELRTWLLGGQSAPDAHANDESFGAALEIVAAEVEDAHGVRVEVVRVRDCPLDEHLRPLLFAAREAMLNAANHAGVPVVSVYLEVEPGRATVFVRDRGRGFDVDGVAPDRRGLAESIVGRMTRHGGTATVRSTPGEGTEVELVMPRRGTTNGDT